MEMDRARIEEAANILLTARGGGDRPPDFPAPCRPRSSEAGYAIQAAVQPALGPIGGWKVGSPSPDGQPLCSPLPQSGLLESPAVAPAPLRYRGVETEIAFRMGRDLPPRPSPYARGDILAAIGSCHAVIEIVESRFAEIDGADHLSALADLQNHHALIIGQPNPAWRDVLFDALPVRLEIDGATVLERVGSNPAGDLIRLVLWLANGGAAWAGGLKAGQIVTTGSWIGKIPAPPHSSIVSRFDGFAPVEARID